jgi:hypothetical protein
MSTQKGRNVRVEVAATYTAAKTVSTISLAAPALVTTSVAHAMAEGTIGYFSGVTGMTEIEGQAASVDTTLASTFLTEGISTVGYGALSGTCSFTPVATWTTLSTSTSYQIGGGEADQIDTTTLLDVVKQSDVGMLAAQSVSFDSFSDPQLAAMVLLEAAAVSGSYVVMRITFPNGERRVFRGIPSLPGESVAVSAMATGSFSVTVKGRVLKLPAA